MSQGNSRTPTIGALRHRLLLEAATRVEDGAGGATLTWHPVAALWAAVQPRGGREMVSADATEARLTHVVRIRHRAGVSTSMRFRQGARLMAIRAVLVTDAGRRWLECLCEEIQP